MLVFKQLFTFFKACCSITYIQVWYLLLKPGTTQVKPSSGRLLVLTTNIIFGLSVFYLVQNYKITNNHRSQRKNEYTFYIIGLLEFFDVSLTKFKNNQILIKMSQIFLVTTKLFTWWNIIISHLTHTHAQHLVVNLGEWIILSLVLFFVLKLTYKGT